MYDHDRSTTLTGSCSHCAPTCKGCRRQSASRWASRLLRPHPNALPGDIWLDAVIVEPPAESRGGAGIARRARLNRHTGVSRHFLSKRPIDESFVVPLPLV